MIGEPARCDNPSRYRGWPAARRRDLCLHVPSADPVSSIIGGYVSSSPQTGDSLSRIGLPRRVRTARISCTYIMVGLVSDASGVATLIVPGRMARHREVGDQWNDTISAVHRPGTAWPAPAIPGGTRNAAGTDRHIGQWPLTVRGRSRPGRRRCWCGPRRHGCSQTMRTRNGPVVTVRPLPSPNGGWIATPTESSARSERVGRDARWRGGAEG